MRYMAFKSKVLRTSCILACGSVGLGASPLAAQQTARVDTAGLEEIVVTAQKRSENLQRAAVAISAISGDDIVNAGISEVRDLSKLVPALVVQPSIGTATNFYLRGVGSFAANAFTDNPIAFNYGGVYIARPAAPLGTFYDLERVEVVKGPQGTLYGRNATGGAINVIPRRASLNETSGEALLEYGSYDAVKISGAINQPIGENTAVRLAAQYADRDGYLSDGYDDENGKAVRASVHSEPTDSLTVQLVADYFKQSGKGGGGVLMPNTVTPNAPHPDLRIGPSDPLSLSAMRAGNPVLVDGGLAISPRGDGFVRNEFWGVAGTLEADLGAVTLTILPAYRVSEPNFLSYNGGYYARVIEEAEQTSVEARLVPNAPGRLDYVVGIFAFDEVQNSYNNFNQGLLLDTQFWVNARNQSGAAFGQATYSIDDGFRVVAGARYTHDRKTMNTVFNQRQFGTGPIQEFSGDVKFNSFTYKAGVEYDAGPSSLAYANIASGYKSGGFFIAPLDNTFEPERLQAFTIGSKNRFLDNRFQANFEVFYWKYRDQQVSFVGGTRTGPTTTGIGLVTQNAGQSRMYGAEVDFAFQATPDDYFTLNAQHLNAEYQDFRYVLRSPNGAPPRMTCRFTPSAAPAAPPAAAFDVDCSGHPQMNAPKWIANVGYERTFEIGSNLELVFGLRSRVESSRFLATEYLPEQHQKAYTQSDAYVTLQDLDHWSVTAFINNIEDETVYAGSNIRAILPVVYNILRPPRTYGVRVNAHF